MSVVFNWWLLIELVGLAGAPLAAAVFRNLPDAGWSLSKPLSLLALGWLIWMPLSLFHALPFNAAWIVGTFLVFALANVALLRVRSVRRALTRLFRESWLYALLTEALFAGAFAAMLWERSFTPEVVSTEKFMDVAFLAAIWRAPHLPIPDPWLSGYSINYYYFGHFLMASTCQDARHRPSGRLQSRRRSDVRAGIRRNLRRGDEHRRQRAALAQGIQPARRGSSGNDRRAADTGSGQPGRRSGLAEAGPAGGED